MFGNPVGTTMTFSPLASVFSAGVGRTGLTGCVPHLHFQVESYDIGEATVTYERLWTEVKTAQ